MDKRGDIHKDLRSPKYKLRIVKDKKKESERKKCRKKLRNMLGIR